MADPPDNEGTNEIEMETASVDERGEGSPRSEVIMIHSDFVQGLQDALGEGGEAFIALTRDPGEEMVSYVMVRDADGAYHLPGIGCDHEQFLRSQLADHYDETLASIVGVTSRGQIKQALAAGGVG